MKRSILIKSPDGSERSFVLDKALVKIGRAADNDIVLVDADRSVSRWHATIECIAGGGVKVTDLNSSNGTMINSRRVNGASPIVADDVIEIGQFRLTLEEESSDGSARRAREQAEEEAHDERFAVYVSAMKLDDLQQKGLLKLAGSEEGAPPEIKNLELLYEVGVTLARSHSVEQVTEAAVGLLFNIEQVHRATVMLWDEAKERFGTSEMHMRNGGRMGAVPDSYNPANVVMSRTILSRVRRENRPLLICDNSERTLQGAASIVRAGIQAAFCSPLTFKGRFLGILYADNLAQPDAFTDADFRTFTSIAAQTGLALANALAGNELLEREMERKALKQYLPPQVADLIIASGGMSQLRGVLQPSITVMYADIRGFTTMSEQMDAREIVDMLNEFFTAMSGVILECDGTLDKFIGDCIMALFGTPVQSENAARDGLKAAIRMQEEMKRLNERRAERGKPPFQIGIGLHCGPAVVGNIGSADRVQYTAIGDTVNVAARLVSKAAAGQIIVSEDIRAGIPDFADFTALGEVELKGRAGKLNIYSARPLEGEAVRVGA